MKHLSDLFEKYKKNLKAPQASVERIVLRVIKEQLSISLEPTQITYNPPTRTVVIKAPSIIKTEITKHRAVVLTALQTELGVQNAPTELL